MRPGTRPAGAANRRGRRRRWWARSRAGQAAGAGRPGGGSGASPSAARSRRTAWGSVTAPTIRRGPAQRGQTRTSIANTPVEEPGPRQPSRRPRGLVAGRLTRSRRNTRYPESGRSVSYMYAGLPTGGFPVFRIAGGPGGDADRLPLAYPLSEGGIGQNRAARGSARRGLTGPIHDRF
jgi:hypothetical protein